MGEIKPQMQCLNFNNLKLEVWRFSAIHGICSLHGTFSQVLLISFTMPLIRVRTKDTRKRVERRRQPQQSRSKRGRRRAGFEAVAATKADVESEEPTEPIATAPEVIQLARA